MDSSKLSLESLNFVSSSFFTNIRSLLKDHPHKISSTRTSLFKATQFTTFPASFPDILAPLAVTVLDKITTIRGCIKACRMAEPASLWAHALHIYTVEVASSGQRMEETLNSSPRIVSTSICFL